MWLLAVLTGDRINGGLQFVRKCMGQCMAVLPGRKKVSVISR